MLRRWLALASLMCSLIVVACNSSAGSAPDAPWDDWTRFAERYIQHDGRLIDWTFEEKSTSEGQAYALFFSLVANDRAGFDRVLGWTSENLAAGELGDKLPAWHWGKKDDGSWGVKDGNSAADGDLWTAYTLLEAARLWKAPQYEQTARKLLTQIAAQEVVTDVQGGAVLLLAPYGFRIGKDRYAFDPCYVPPFQFRYLAAADPQGPWQSILDGYLSRSPQIFKAGVAPDQLIIDQQGHIFPDPDRPTASYDAIRVYLWAALSQRDGQAQLPLLRRYAEIIRRDGRPPEKVNTSTGEAVQQAWSPIGFMAAVLPYLQVLGEDGRRKELQAAMQRERMRVRLTGQPNYYDEVLVLFGLGWIEKRYGFDEQGRLVPAWKAT